MINTSKRVVLLEHATITESRPIAVRTARTRAKMAKRPCSTWPSASGRAHATSRPASTRVLNAAPGKKWPTLWSMRPIPVAHLTMKRATLASVTQLQSVQLAKVRLSENLKF